MNTTLFEKAEKSAAAFCAAAAALTTEVRAAGVAARKAARRAAEAPCRAARAEAAHAAGTTLLIAARAEALMDESTPNPDGAGPDWEAVIGTHMTLDTATRVALQAADQAAALA